MFIVRKPQSRDYREMGEQWELRCAKCGKAFRTLLECYLAYQNPAAGCQSEAVCCHKRCADSGAAMRLMRSDFALKRVFEPLVTPIPPAALHDEPRTRGRLDWSAEP